VSFGCSSSERAKRTDALKKPQSRWLDRVRSKYRNTPAFRPRTVQANVGYTLDMAVKGSLELYQAIVHHGTANEVVVAGR